MIFSMLLLGIVQKALGLCVFGSRYLSFDLALNQVNFKVFNILNKKKVPTTATIPKVMPYIKFP